MSEAINEILSEKDFDIVRARLLGDDISDISVRFNRSPEDVKFALSQFIATRKRMALKLKKELHDFYGPFFSAEISSGNTRRRVCAVLDSEVSVSHFTERVRGALRYNEVRTYRDLTRKSEANFMRAPNFGSESLKELKEHMEDRGFYLNGCCPNVS